MPWKKLEEKSCTIQYDTMRQLLKVVDSEHSIIHVFNPLDIIGVEVEIKLLYEIGTQTAFCNPTSGNTSPVDRGCNILDSVNENKDIFHCQHNDFIPVDSHATAILNIYTYPKAQKSTSWWCSAPDSTRPNPHYSTPGTGPRYAHHYAFPVSPSHDFEGLTELVQSIRTVAKLGPRKKFLILINPKSGTGAAPEIWKSTVRPMLEQQAGMDCTVVSTEYAQHAKEHMERSVKLTEYDAVVCLGGDGVLHEVLQGWQTRDDFQEVLKKIKLGVVGCGTGNGLAKSLTHEAEVRRDDKGRNPLNWYAFAFGSHDSRRACRNIIPTWSLHFSLLAVRPSRWT